MKLQCFAMAVVLVSAFGMGDATGEAPKGLRSNAARLLTELPSRHNQFKRLEWGGLYNGPLTANGNMHGFGVLQYPNGDEYRGDFINNIKHGQGEYFPAQGSVYKYQGAFANNKRNGEGVLFYRNGTRFHGNFVNGETGGEYIPNPTGTQTGAPTGMPTHANSASPTTTPTTADPPAATASPTTTSPPPDAQTLTVGNIFVDTADVDIQYGDLVLSSTLAQSIKHSGGAGEDFAITSMDGNVEISSTNADVMIELVTFAAGAVSGLTTLDTTGDITVAGGNLAMTSTLAQSITHMGGAGEDLSISSNNGNVAISSMNGDVVIESVTVAEGEVSGVSQMTVGNVLIQPSNVDIGSGNLWFSSTRAQSIKHVGGAGADFDISSMNGDVVIEGLTVSGSVLTGISSLGVSSIDVGGAATVGDVDIQYGDLVFSSNGAQAITHMGGAGQDFSISSMDGNVAILSTNADVVIETVMFNAGAVSAVTTLEANSDITMTAGNLEMTSTFAQTITHTGTSSTPANALSISSTFGDVAISAAAGDASVSISSGTAVTTVESVTFTGQAVTGVSTLEATGDITVAGGNLVFSSTFPQAITHTGVAGSDFTISSMDGNVELYTDDTSQVKVTGTQAATSNTTGALHVAGGVSIAKDLYCGEDLYMTDNIIMGTNARLNFRETGGGGKFVNLKAPAAITTSYTLSMPIAQGAADQVLTNDGAGALSWETPAAGGASITTGTIDQGDDGSGLGTDVTLNTMAGVINLSIDVYPSGKFEAQRSKSFVLTNSNIGTSSIIFVQFNGAYPIVANVYTQASGSCIIRIHNTYDIAIYLNYASNVSFYIINP